MVAFLCVVSARTRLTAHAGGGQVSVPVLGLVAVAVVLALAALVLLILRNGLWLRPRVVRP